MLRDLLIEHSVCYATLMAKEEVVTEFLDQAEYNERMNGVSHASEHSPNLTRIPRSVKRSEVVAAFHECFETIGGVPRMAQWAGEHPGDFFRLYAKLLPSQASKELDDQNSKVIRHVLPRTSLDE